MSDTQIEKRLKILENHLKQETNMPADIVNSFRELDEIARNLGFLDSEESYATRVSWWPMISVLGTFSSGKSTFINHYIGQKLQRTGTQAVDDKFTVICYGSSDVASLPGTALDSDPRFPFYQISHDVKELVATSGSGQRIDSYLQLKISTSETLRGRILIDSPGFDADSQRTSTLKIVKHIVDLSDLVLVFFDARHPEPGAMRDTLQHLVAETINRPDANKFIYILNQVDVTAREDNLEEVVAAWQRALAQTGLTAGRFYRIYNPNVAMPIEDEVTRSRYNTKNDADTKEILGRMEQVSTERSYRIIGVFEQAIKDIEHKLIPQLTEWLECWRSQVFWWNTGIIAVLLAVLAGLYGVIQPDLSGLKDLSQLAWAEVGGAVLVFLFLLNAKVGSTIKRRLLKQMDKKIADDRLRDALKRGFNKNAGAFKFSSSPCGWNKHIRQELSKLLGKSNDYVQKLNDRFTNPSGQVASAPAAETAPAPTPHA